MLASFSVREVTGYAGENVYSGTDVVVVPCGVLAFTAEKGRIVHNRCSFPYS